MKHKEDSHNFLKVIEQILPEILTFIVNNAQAMRCQYGLSIPRITRYFKIKSDIVLLHTQYYFTLYIDSVAINFRVKIKREQADDYSILYTIKLVKLSRNKIQPITLSVNI